MSRTLSDDDLDLIAAAMSRVRPEWPRAALRAYLRERYADNVYPFAALLVAAVFYSIDRKHETPLDLDRRGRHWLYASEAAHPRAPGGTQREDP